MQQPRRPKPTDEEPTWFRRVFGRDGLIELWLQTDSWLLDVLITSWPAVLALLVWSLASQPLPRLLALAAGAVTLFVCLYRRRRQRRRELLLRKMSGQCLVCGLPMNAAEVCPDCGWRRTNPREFSDLDASW